MKNSQEEALVSGALSALWHAHSGTAAVVDAAKLGSAREEHYVAELIRTGLPILARHWSSTFAAAGLSVAITGVFVHKRPMASFRMGASSQSCELGDCLLVVRNFVTGTKTATLLQAKMGVFPVPHDLSVAQDYLYVKWPEFQLKSKSFGGYSYRLSVVSSQSARMYIRAAAAYPEDIVDYPRNSPFAYAYSVSFDAIRSVAELLVDCCMGVGGRPITYPAESGCDWSRLVSDLETVTAAQLLRAWGLSGGLRGTTVMAFASDGASGVSDAPLRGAIEKAGITGLWNAQEGNSATASIDGPEIPSLQSDDDGGISVISIEIRQLG